MAMIMLAPQPLCVGRPAALIRPDEGAVESASGLSARVAANVLAAGGRLG
jgi:hypothetical protein